MCGNSFTVQHAFSCPCGGFPSIRHNELCNLTAELLSEVCTDVGIEPALQPLDSEPLWYATANREDSARLDVVARAQTGSMHFLTLGCLTHLQAPIRGLLCSGAMLPISKKRGVLMMRE